MLEFLNLNKRIEKIEAKESLFKKNRDVRVFLKNNASVIEDTATPALRLHLYNFLSKNPKATEEDLQKVFKKINNLSKLEKEYSKDDNLLPTIGIEIEIPNENLTDEKIKILDSLDIPNETTGHYKELEEVNPNFSYSPWVQARIIQELAEMGALPLKKIEENYHKKISDQTPLSLHVNFGMPREITRQILEQNTDEVSLLNDTLIYAFTSPNRIDNRKTVHSSYFKDKAQSSKKNEDKNYTNKKSSEMNDTGSEVLMRLELRAFEFKDYPTYRMLAESQRLTAMFISYLKTYVDHSKINSKELELAMLWKKFENEIKDLFNQFNLSPEMIDLYHEKVKIMEILKTTDLKDRCRNIVTKYSKEVQKVLKLED